MILPLTYGHPSTRADRAREGAPCARARTPVGTIYLESCHSTWIFDGDRMQFCRILRMIEPAGRPVRTAWRPYCELKVDTEDEGFTVFLNASRTQRIRSWRHASDCAQCACQQTASQESTR